MQQKPAGEEVYDQGGGHVPIFTRRLI